MRTRRERYQSPQRSEERENTRHQNQAPHLQAPHPQAQHQNLTTDLKQIYENVKSVPSYSSKIRDFLRRNQTSSIFKQVRHKFPRRRIVAHFPYQIVMSDTINYRNVAGPQNKGYKYIMVVVDVFSKLAWAEPMRRLNEIILT